MPLRDRWNRVFSRKSLSSGSSDGSNPSNSGHGPVDGTSHSSAPTPVTPAVPGGSSNAGHELAKTTSRLAKTLTWRSSNALREKPPKLPSAPSSSNKKSKKKKMHPSERPLTETNLKHQEMLSHFTMTFGRTRRSSSAGQSSFSDCSNISPYGSRAPSFDAAAIDYEYGHGHQGRYDRRMSSLVPPEMSSGEESERTS